MAEPTAGLELGHIAALLAAGVVAVPIFRRFQLGSVLGYLAAGLAIGPFGIGLFREPEVILHVAEFGVVIFLFIIGLEMRPTRLWSLRKDIFGLGAAQVMGAGILLTFTGMAAGLSIPVAFVAAMGFVLSSTAVIMQMLDERGDLSAPQGQRAVSILLLEDLAIVPLLAVVAVMASVMGLAGEAAPPLWRTLGLAIGAVAVVFLAGKYLMNPVFRILARYGGREVMTAAALLVVVGAAWLMDLGGVIAFMAVKAVAISGVARIFKASEREAVERAVLFAQGGEFAFVLYAAALTTGVFDARISGIATAVVILSMVLTPLTTIAIARLMPPVDLDPDGADGVDRANNLRERVLIIGFGRFAQVVSQPLLARDVDVSIIDMDVEMIQAAGNFGFKVYYGDGARLDVLRASGAANAETILVCVDKPETADRIVELVKAEFPLTKLFVRAYDRGHAIRLVQAGVEYQLRETFESALVFGHQVLIDLGFTHEQAEETIEDVRRRDDQRLSLQMVEGITAGRSLMRGNIRTTKPEPYVKPRREGQALNEEAADALEEEEERENAGV